MQRANLLYRPPTPIFEWRESVITPLIIMVLLPMIVGRRISRNIIDSSMLCAARIYCENARESLTTIISQGPSHADIAQRDMAQSETSAT
jgi:hypothetical protein